ncbi:ABC transporter ATP-binding protein [Microlunatus ginsengisoli]|uniref:ABC transporter ATP-binding protein n=1 Tax=Microlunatus ginsengisoli TaxID=363863 RepID=A0ABP6ZNA2_9ACTN
MTTGEAVATRRPPERAILPVASGRETGRVFWRLILGHRWLAIGSVLSSVAASVAAVLVPILLGRVVDLVVDRGSGADLVRLVIAIAVAGLGAGVLTAASRYLVSRLGAEVCADLREDVMDKALRMDSARLELAGAGDVASRVTEDVDKITTSIRLAANVFAALVTVVVTVAGFASLDWRIAVAFFAVVPVYVVSVRLFLPTARRLYAADRQAAAVRTQSMLTTLYGARTVHAYGMEALQSGRVETASRHAVQAAIAAVRGFLGFANSMNFAEAVGLSAVLLTGFFGVRSGITTVGDVTAAALLFHRLFGPLGTLLMTFNDIQSAGAALARLVGIAELAVPPGPAGDVPAPGEVAVAATGVRHSYTGDVEVLHDVGVHVPAGTSLAVVGESGAGKTTLAALLGGVFPASAGDIRIGSEGIDGIDPVTLRRLIGVVTQEVHVFTGTLADDLRLALPGASDEALWAALRVTGAAEWVEALPDRLGTRVGDGEHPLSAAQAQQLALTRVALVDPPVVILDEATAEAGSAGARALEASAAALLAGRTAIVVAHRLTQAQACDRIAVMAAGRIIESGSHDELVAAGGTYARLWAAWHS